MACTGRFAEAQDFASFWCLNYALSAEEQATIEVYLDLTASDIHAAMAQSGMCDCTLASWATNYLNKLNIIEAAAFYQCSCANPKLTDEMRMKLIDWASLQLDNIRTMAVDLCAGATGSDFPAIGWAEMGLTEWSEAQIILNALMRYGT